MLVAPQFGTNASSKVDAAIRPRDPVSEFVRRCEDEQEWKKRMEVVKREKEEHPPWASTWKLSGQVSGKPLPPQPRFLPSISGAASHHQAPHINRSRRSSMSDTDSCHSSIKQHKWVLHHGPDAKEVMHCQAPALPLIPEGRRRKQEKQRKQYGEFIRQRDNYLRQYKADLLLEHQEIVKADDEARKRRKPVLKSEIRLTRIVSGRARNQECKVRVVLARKPYSSRQKTLYFYRLRPMLMKIVHIQARL